MKDGTLDELDRSILYALQQDSRHTSSGDIAEREGVSASTVRKRIQRLEEEGIITGYHVAIDYETAGLPLHAKLVCSAPIPQREELARQARDIPGVEAVREIMNGHNNVYINIIGTDHDDLSRIGQDLYELGLDIEDEQIIRNEYVCPYRGFLARDDLDW
ncbi:Lrp/AsnC family transcriptional regulator [Haladaptatus halobius]|uniref:Lrp/AsnC family transcriptional regulator n=1 Tax=Haladaptatus halobius TaxID=2884875 RepID=UPI001D09D682|nr:Lrp/AsnC family transcriptional regulator [Haladaptatus halobius]